MEREEVRVLALDQVRTLYAGRLTTDFPPDEVKSLAVIEGLLAQGRYLCYGYCAGGAVLAYAFFVCVDGEALLDYFAVREDLRGRGVGGRFLRALMAGPLAGMRRALLEVDDPDFADDPEERARRVRRLRFYLGRGMTDTGVRANVFCVDYRILAMPVGGEPDAREVRRVYAGIYRTTLPAELYESMVRIGEDGGVTQG